MQYLELPEVPGCSIILGNTFGFYLGIVRQSFRPHKQKISLCKKEIWNQLTSGTNLLREFIEVAEILFRFFCNFWLFATPWTTAHQALLSIGFPRQEYWSGLPFPPPGDLPDPGIKPGSPALQADSLLSEPPGEPPRSLPTWGSWILIIAMWQDVFTPILKVSKMSLKDINLLKITGKEAAKLELSWGHGSSLFVVVQSLIRVQLFATPRAVVWQASLSFTISWSLLKLISMELVIPSNHLILCCPLFLLPSIFPSIRVFSNDSALCIRWPKYWSFSPSNEYSGLIFFRMAWSDLLAVQGTLKSLLQHHNLKVFPSL